jgi:hypothetical protein
MRGWPLLIHGEAIAKKKIDSPHQQVTTRENDRVSHRMQTKKTLTGEGMRLLMMMGLII